MLPRNAIIQTADEIRLRLSHPDDRPSDLVVVAHWRGMLVALEHVLGEPPTLDDGPAAALLAQVSAFDERASSPAAHIEQSTASWPVSDDLSHGDRRLRDTTA